MIIGTGDIARALVRNKADRPELLFFAAGVSNSQETRESEYWREIERLRRLSRDAHIVYFSSLSIFYGETRYTGHKRYMEQTVRRLFTNWTIVRLGNITWGNNPHTLINTLRERERLGQRQTLRDVYRYIVDEDEFIHWVNLIPTDSNCEMNITGRRLKVADIYREFVQEAVTA